MSTHSLFRSHLVALRQCAVSGGVLVVLAVLLAGTWRSHAATNSIRHLSFEDRIAYQRALEAVYHRHRLWPQDNPTPKPALEAVLPEAVLRAKVEDALRQSNALARYWQQPITPEQLQAELERMAQNTKQPAVLRELWAALDNDPFVIAECLARPLLAERELGMRITDCGSRNGRCEALGLTKASDPQTVIRTSPFAELSVEVQGTGFQFQLPTIAEAAVPEAACGSDSWTATNTTGAPSARDGYTAVWTGSEMIIWGGISGNNFLNTGGRYNPATDAWIATSTINTPSVRWEHTAVWTGTEMIVWGGASSNDSYLSTGGRYNPATNTWTATSTTDAPLARAAHRAVWTGSEVIIWGGANLNDPSRLPRTGGRYNPATNTWTATDTNGSPVGRLSFTAVWTGSEMIVWGGYDDRDRVNTGGRYNPTTNTWAVTNTTGAPSGREFHTAVWTGSEMIVWGGREVDNVNTGGRYNPSTNLWITTSITGVPSSRRNHTAVWTNSEMIVWGGTGADNTGGRYNSATNTWATTTTTDAPSGRSLHTAVWTGSEMIIWGGSSANTGGHYSLNLLTLSQTTQSFTATGGSGSVAVTAQGGCTWTATSNANWLTTTSSGSGNGTVNFTVAANPSASQRTGTLTIGAQTFTVTQAAATPIAVSLATTLTAAPGANLVVPIMVGDLTGSNVVAYDFVLTFDPSVLQLQSTPIDAAGTLSSGFTFTPNTSTAGRLTVSAFGTTALTGTGTLLKLNFTVVGQAGAATPLTWQSFRFNEGTPEAATTNGRFTITNPCSYALTPTTQSFTSDGGTGAVNITTASGCVWIATSEADWITITSSRSGVGSDTLRYEVARNTAGMRSSTITISGQRLTITQAGTLASVNAASYVGGMLAQESIVSAFGSDLATGTQSASGGSLPTTILGTNVRVKDSAGVERLAPLFFVSPMQVNYQLPPGTALGAATMTLTSGDAKQSTGTITVVAVAPGVFTATSDGKGLAVGIAVHVKLDSTQVREPLVEWDGTKFVARPIDLGPTGEIVILELYGTGIRHRTSQAAVTATIGGANATLHYAREAPGFIGLDQMNLEVPRSLAGRGEVDVVVVVDGKSANGIKVVIK